MQRCNIWLCFLSLLACSSMFCSCAKQPVSLNRLRKQSQPKKLFLRVAGKVGITAYQTTVEGLEEYCDAIVTVSVPRNSTEYVPEPNFEDGAYFPVQEQLTQPVQIQQILYKKPNISLHHGQSIEITEAVSTTVFSPHSSTQLATVVQDSFALSGGSQYLLYLRWTATEGWVLDNPNNGRFNLDGTDPNDNSYPPDAVPNRADRRQLRDAIARHYHISIAAALQNPIINGRQVYHYSIIADSP